MTILENRKLLATVVAAAVVIASIVGLYLAGSPAEARLLRLDDRRVDDLRSISWSLAEYRQGRGRLPPTLDSLPMAIGDAPRLRDPATERPYTYEVTGDSSYILCAEFARPSPSERDGGYDAAWRHRPGHFCFPLTATARP
jgi:hypothetical protein